MFHVLYLSKMEFFLKFLLIQGISIDTIDTENPVFQLTQGISISVDPGNLIL